MFNLALMYDQGEGVEKSKTEAFKLLEKAHAAGHSDATFYVALMYEEGDGVGQDKAKALELYHQAHAAGSALSRSSRRFAR